MPEAAPSLADTFVRELLDSYPDHPRPGILFRDLTPVFANGAAFRAVIEELTAPGDGTDAADYLAIAGVEARGFLLASAGAYRSGCGVLAVRKAGKLPGVVIGETYDLEYGSACLEMHPGQLPRGSRVLLVDDLLATGGTLEAAATLLERSGYIVSGIRIVLELEGLGGRDRLSAYDVRAICTV
ncbi:MAG: adenine phosphoribosyltransferase [Burkholderiaceae bacterium]|nr:adenine phosphoribosyltransferase [Microbacteriaceae bacterium]